MDRGVPAATSPHPDPPHQGEGTTARLINLPFINGKVLGRAQSCSRPSGARSRGGLGQIPTPSWGGLGWGRSVKLPPSGARSRGGLGQTPSPSWGGSGWGAVSRALALRGKVSRRAGPNSLRLVGRAGVGAVSQAPAHPGQGLTAGWVKLPPPRGEGRGGGQIPNFPGPEPFFRPHSSTFPNVAG